MPTTRYSTIAQARCVACGACIKVCPKNAISIWHGCYATIDIEACVGCGRCAKTCPAGCITMKDGAAHE